MKTWIANWWLTFTTGFWFVPGLFLLGGLGLGLATPELDVWFQNRSGYVPDSLQISGTTARAMLTALTGAMFTVTGVVFSTTTVALSITSNQLGPRLLRNFLSQNVTQITFGVCLASCVYSLMLLRRIDKLEGDLFIPQGSLLFSSVLGLVTLMTVVYFTHRVVHSMQAQNVVSDVADDLDDAVKRLFPEKIGRPANQLNEEVRESSWQTAWRELDDRPCAVIESANEGYLQAIDDDGLIRIGSEKEVVVRVHARPGDYVCEGEPLMDAVGAEGELESEVERRFQRLFLFGNSRTTQQDVECAVNELVEVALRALSPGINDPFTAFSCIDRLSGALRRLAARRPASGVRYDSDGERRVVIQPRTFSNVVDAAFNQLRQNAAGKVAVTVRLLDALRSIASATERDDDRRVLEEQAEMVVEDARERGYQPRDFKDIESEYKAFQEAIKSTRPS